MAARRDGEALLVTGVYGTGKTSMVEEIADLLEERGLPYAALDLDWLDWFNTGAMVEDTEHGMLLANVRAVIANYRSAGVGYFLLAGTVRTTSELERLRAVVPVPLKVVRLTVPLEEIDRRLQAHVTTARHRDDLPQAAADLAASPGEGIEDLTVANDRPIREVADEILGWLGWVTPT
jgi:adenylylsulfate kinase